MEASQFLWHCSRDSGIVKFSALEVSLSVKSCWRKAVNYQKECQISEHAF